MRKGSSAELAAVVLATSFFFVLFLMGSGFALAVSPMVAAASAQGDIVQARRTTRMGVWLTLAFAAISLPLMIWSGPLLRLLGQTAEISDLAQQYLRMRLSEGPKRFFLSPWFLNEVFVKFKYSSCENLQKVEYSIFLTD